MLIPFLIFLVTLFSLVGYITRHEWLHGGYRWVDGPDDNVVTKIWCGYLKCSCGHEIHD